MGFLQQGGPAMYIILVLLLLSLYFIVKAFISKSKDEEHSKKMIGLAVDSSLLSLVVGCLGSILGVMRIFNMAQALGEIKPDLFSAGLTVSLSTICFGLFSFVIGRLGILIYKWSLGSEGDK